MNALRSLAFHAFAYALVALAVLMPGCSSGFGRVGPSARLEVHIVQGVNRGSPDARLPLLVTRTTSFTVRVEAHNADGSLATSFNGFVRASIKPGTVVALHNGNVDGRNVQLVNGVTDGLVVDTQSGYGDARIWFEDVGYTPADPASSKAPQCSNGIDDNGNGAIDYPTDPGCAFPNDDTEDGGSFATGASEPLYFRSPRISDVRGYDPLLPGSGNGTLFPHEQVQIDTGWRPEKGAGVYAFNTIVTRIAADGFYVTDTQNDYTDPSNPPPGFGSVFAFTFSTPPKMRVCDRAKMLGGTASDFFGFTEIGFPTWLVEEWDPTLRECGVPAPVMITPTTFNNLFPLESSMVRVQNVPGSVSVHVTKKFGPNLVPHDANGYTLGEDATNCDYNKDGKIDFTKDPEAGCAAACDGSATVPADSECTEYSAFAAHGDFKLVVRDESNGQTIKVQVNASSDATFDPVAHRGKDIGAFTGTFRYFSGGSQFTIEARCEDDIIRDPLGTPFCSDTDYDTLPSPCKDIDGNPQTTLIRPARRRLACVHARSISDNNESSH